MRRMTLALLILEAAVALALLLLFVWWTWPKSRDGTAPVRPEVDAKPEPAAPAHADRPATDRAAGSPPPDRGP